MADDERVSLNEIVEVRDAGFNSAELLAIIYASCEHLLSKPAGKKGLFSPNLIYITHQGRIQVLLIILYILFKCPLLLFRSTFWNPYCLSLHHLNCIAILILQQMIHKLFGALGR